MEHGLRQLSLLGPLKRQLLKPYGGGSAKRASSGLAGPATKIWAIHFEAYPGILLAGITNLVPL
ncbi:MAG: hypothetical protein BMS9Abin15_1006 [Gammaproteobacteria bacterium]|nr:MAG: hypothetical protein BMS9Abin15_1006 [Gammaproteobacteria bacterium]